MPRKKLYTALEARKMSLGLCIVKYCNRKSNKGRGYKNGNHKCPRCSKRQQKEDNPISYHYDNLKSNARRRDKEFKLTRKEYEVFCKETGYLQLKGRGAKDIHIDRVDESKGYTIDNIQLLSNSQNVKKYVYYVNGKRFIADAPANTYDEVPF